MATTLRELAQELDAYIKKEYFLALSEVPPEYPEYTKMEDWEKNGDLFSPLMRRREIATIEAATPRGETEATHIQTLEDGRTKDLENPIRYATGLAFSKDKMQMGIGALTSVKKVAQFLQDAVRMTKEHFYVEILNEIEDGTNCPEEAIGFDGKPPIAYDHQLLKGGTASNYHYDTSGGAPIYSSVTYTVLNDVLSKVARTVDESGNYHPVYRVNELWVPVEEEANALEVLKSRTRPDVVERADSVITDRSAQSLSMSSVKTLLYMTPDRWFAVDGGRHEITRYTLEDGGVEGPVIDDFTKIATWMVEFWIHRAVWGWRGLYMVPMTP